MNFLEKNLEDIVFETDNVLLEDRGLYIEGIKRRQVRIGNYGICDLITIKRISKVGFLQITVYELKKDLVNTNTFLQGIRYCRGIQSYLTKRRIASQINLTLIGSEIDISSDFVYLPQIISSEEFEFSIYTYKYGFDGINFNPVTSYSLNNEGF